MIKFDKFERVCVALAALCMVAIAPIADPWVSMLCIGGVCLIVFLVLGFCLEQRERKESANSESVKQSVELRHHREAA